MKLRTFTLCLWCFLMASATMASEQHRTEVRIVVDDHDTGHSVINFDSEDSGIDLEKLEVGESKTYTDDEGNDVTVTRNEDGFEFEVAGEKIVLADVLSNEHGIKMLHLADEQENVVVEKHHKVHVVSSDDEAGVTIISGDEIDDETRARIEQVLKEAGKNGEVLFIDGSELSGDERAEREVRIIKKEIDVTN